jgi:hypothetical protein
MPEATVKRGPGRPPKPHPEDDAVLNVKGIPHRVADRFREIALSEGVTQAEVLEALTAIYDAGARRDEVEAELASLEARLDKARTELRSVESIREQAEAHAANLHQASAERAQREVGMSRAAVELLMSLVEVGATRDSILRWGQALLAAQIEPEAAARMMERVGGLLRLAEQLQTGCDQVQEMRDQRLQEVSAARQALEMLQAKARQLEKAIGEVGADLEHSRAHARQVEAAAKEFGVYLEILSAPGGRVEAWPQQVARAIAGVVLFAALQRHAGERDANPELELPANLQLGRMPVRIRLSELPGILAPPSTYAAMLQAERERDAMAAHMASTGGLPAPVDPGATAADQSWST